jgi:hypothetical protein
VNSIGNTEVIVPDSPVENLKFNAVFLQRMDAALVETSHLLIRDKGFRQLEPMIAAPEPFRHCFRRLAGRVQFATTLKKWVRVPLLFKNPGYEPIRIVGELERFSMKMPQLPCFVCLS